MILYTNRNYKSSLLKQTAVRFVFLVIILISSIKIWWLVVPFFLLIEVLSLGEKFTTKIEFDELFISITYYQWLNLKSLHLQAMNTTAALEKEVTKSGYYYKLIFYYDNKKVHVIDTRDGFIKAECNALIKRIEKEKLIQDKSKNQQGSNH